MGPNVLHSDKHHGNQATRVSEGETLLFVFQQRGLQQRN